MKLSKQLRNLMSIVLVLAIMVMVSMPTALAAKDEALYQKCVDHQQDALTDLATIVNIDSGTTDKEGVKAVQNILMERLQEIGADVEVIDFSNAKGEYLGSNVVARLSGTGTESVLMAGHADTVFGPGTVEKRPFHIEGNRAYGPGVADDKVGLVAGLHALEIIKEMGIQNYGRITLVITPDEEKGSRASRDLIMKLAKEHKYTLNLEPSGNLEMNESVSIWNKGIGRITMEVFGKSSHAGIAPEEGRNATVELAHQIQQLSNLGDSKQLTTVNWTVLEGTKTPTNVIPDYAKAQADIRVMYYDEYDRVMRDAETIIKNKLIPDTEIKLSLVKGRPPFSKNDKTDHLVNYMQGIYRDELGRTLGAFGSGAGSDANYAFRAGSITVDGLGFGGDGYHSDKEYAEIETIIPRLYLLTRALVDLSSGNVTID